MEALILFNFSMVFVSIFVLRRFPPGMLKVLFLLFAAAFCLYSAPAIALDEFRPSREDAVLLSRLILLGGALTAGSFFVLLLAFVDADTLRSHRVRALLSVPPAVGGLAFAPESTVRFVLDYAVLPLSLAGVVLFAFYFIILKNCKTDFERYRLRLLARAIAPGLFLFFTGAALYPFLFGSPLSLPGPFLFLLVVPGMYATIRFNKRLYLLRRLDDGCQDMDLLFEDRFGDLVRGIGALRDVLLDRKINTGRLLILNSEENLSIERTSSQVESSPEEFPCGLQCKPLGHLAGVLEDYARLERRVSLMNFALMRYENMALEQDEKDQKNKQGEQNEKAHRHSTQDDRSGLRIHDPLLVLYHYLAEPEDAFSLNDALDVIEREDLQHFLKNGLVVRRPGAAGLAFSRQALARVEGQTGVLTT